jgi:hypothetical protein
MLPRLEAGETLVAVNRAALGNNTGFESEQERQRVIEALRHKASGEAPPAPAKADPSDLAAMGIAVQAAGEDAAPIADLAAWLDHPPGSAAAGENGRG